MIFEIIKFLSIYSKDNRGLATVEAVILLPIMITILMGMFDIGQAIIISQKVTAASHMASDLITRQIVVNDSDLDNAYGAAKLVIDPYDRSSLGIDIVGIVYDDDNDPQETWRKTYNMGESTDLPSSADGLGVDGEGIVAVSVTYDYEPYFSSSIIGSYTMEEISYLRGRKNSFIQYEDE